MSRGSRYATRNPAPTLSNFGRVVTNRRVWTVGLLEFLGYALYLFVTVVPLVSYRRLAAVVGTQRRASRFLSGR
jgi:hypothetical protein